MKFSAYAFDHDGNLIDYKVNTIGQIHNPLILDKGKTYSIIVLSCNSEYIPEKITNINSALYCSCSDVYLWKGEFSPKENSKTIDIFLKPLYSKTKFVFGVKNLEIYSDKDLIFKNFKLTDVHNSTIKIDLNNGQAHNHNKSDLLFSFNGRNGDIHQSNFQSITKEYGTNTGYLKGTIVAPPDDYLEFEDVVYLEKDVSIPVEITSGKIQTFRINLTGQVSPDINILPIIDFQIRDGSTNRRRHHKMRVDVPDTSNFIDIDYEIINGDYFDFKTESFEKIPEEEGDSAYYYWWNISHLRTSEKYIGDDDVLEEILFRVRITSKKGIYTLSVPTRICGKKYFNSRMCMKSK